MSRHSGTCRSCHAPVIWVETEATAKKAGRKMPLDADPENPAKALKVLASGDDPDKGHDGKGLGNLLFTRATTGDGTYIVRYVRSGPNLYRSHFATCPDAKTHRR